jgi:hypothetical protein
MKAFRIALSISLMFWVIPALAQSIKTDYDSSYDFSKLRTFDFAPQDPQSQKTLLQNSLNEKRIKAALESHLNANGFSKSEDGKPDFFIAHRIAGQPKKRVETRSLPPIGRRGGPGQPVQPVQPIQIPQAFLEGSVIVDFIDSASNQLVWRGFAIDPIDPAKPEKLINKGIEKLVKEFMKNAGRKK